jgi:catechol 2,3-dioxygenase-like lactoylglutathione lyase family enzyme
MTVPATAVPVLPVSDLVRSVAWYERLGFQVRARYEGYAIVGFDGAELHLNEMPSLPAADQSVSGAYLRVADADAVHAHWSAMGAPTIAAPEDQPYGIREFATEDLDGNLWRVGAPIADRHAEGLLPPDAPTIAPGPGAPELVPIDVGDGHEPEQVPHPQQPAPNDAGDRHEPEQVPRPGQPVPIDVGEGRVQEREGGAPDGGTEGRRCPVCGLVDGELAARAIGAQVRDEVHPFGELLARADDDAVRRRTGPDGWSALEPGVHVRDSLSRFAEHIIRTLAEHGPQLGTWERDASVADGMANESDVGAVVDDLQRNAAKLSEALRLVSDEDWDRPATQGDERTTIERLARTALHEVVHERTAAQATLAAASDRSG